MTMRFRRHELHKAQHMHNRNTTWTSGTELLAVLTGSNTRRMEESERFHMQLNAERLKPDSSWSWCSCAARTAAPTGGSSSPWGRGG